MQTTSSHSDNASRQSEMILFASGTRADWGLLSPLIHALRKKGAKVGVAATNMHLRPECGLTVNEIRADGFEPVAEIPLAGPPAAMTAMATSGFAELFNRIVPKAVVILGDRFEMLGVATAALLTGVPVVHIAGGTVSEGAFDDSIRHAISKMATLHFPETEQCRLRLLAMGEDPQCVVTAGAIGVTNVLATPLMQRDEFEQSIGMAISGTLIVATLHAATLQEMDPEMQMQAFLSGLSTAMRNDPQLQVLLTYPNNDVDIFPMIRRIEEFAATWGKLRVAVVPSLGRVRYMTALSLASAVAGNSSSGLVEVPSMGIPTLDVGPRQAGRECGPSVLHCGMQPHEIAKGIEMVLSPDMKDLASKRENPYHRPDTVSLMAEKIMNFHFTRFPQKKFHHNNIC